LETAKSPFYKCGIISFSMYFWLRTITKKICFFIFLVYLDQEIFHFIKYSTFNTLRNVIFLVLIFTCL
jgi:hypothetical protein